MSTYNNRNEAWSTPWRSLTHLPTASRGVFGKLHCWGSGVPNYLNKWNFV
jgi:hypothetical protein